MFKKRQPVYMIGVVADLLQVHPQTLRIYEREGLVVPGRSRGNTRLYSQEDVERLHLVLRLTREFGVNLAGVEVILNLRGQLERSHDKAVDLIEQILENLTTTDSKKMEKKRPSSKRSHSRFIPIRTEEKKRK